MSNSLNGTKTAVEEFDPSEDCAPLKLTTVDGKPYKYAWALPTFDPNFKLPPLQPFNHVDPGHRALKLANPTAFLDKATSVEDLTPYLGAVVEGIQLNKLTNDERDQLALYVARKKVVAFRDQDFVDESPEWLLNDWGRYFGRLHIHPTSGQPKDYPELHLIYRDDQANFNYEPDRLSSTLWHSDVSYEQQPPGITTLFLFDAPQVGGDTLFASQVESYNRLSPSFRTYLETLQVEHSGVEQAEHSRSGRRGGVVKREPVKHVHPLVRRHPVTGEKALYVNRQFSRRIIGLKKDESDALLEFLYTHLEKGADFHARIRWRPRTVVVWDNRVTAHSVVVDFVGSGERRHGARITPQAERPFI